MRKIVAVSLVLALGGCGYHANYSDTSDYTPYFAPPPASLYATPGSVYWHQPPAYAPNLYATPGSVYWGVR